MCIPQHLAEEVLDYAEEHEKAEVIVKKMILDEGVALTTTPKLPNVSKEMVNSREWPRGIGSAMLSSRCFPPHHVGRSGGPS